MWHVLRARRRQHGPLEASRDRPPVSVPVMHPAQLHRLRVPPVVQELAPAAVPMQSAQGGEVLQGSRGGLVLRRLRLSRRAFPEAVR